MKLFISQPMNGIPDEEIIKNRSLAINIAQEKFPNEHIELIDNFCHKDAPANAGRIWHLGRSIQQLEEADAIIFIDGWEKARGCMVERLIAELYKIMII